MNERWRRLMKALMGCEAKSVSAALALLTASGCSGPGNERAETCGVTEESLYRTGTLWPTGFSATHWIQVCFTPGSMQRPDFPTVRNNIRRAVNATWGRAANLVFTGFDSCGASANGKLKILIVNPTSSDGSAEGLAHTGYQGPNSPTELLITSNAGQGLIAHEFGHLLGFPHEMTRPDFVDDPTGKCREDNISGGDTLGTPANDRQSIMANHPYCGSFPQTLAPWDVVGVQNAYGRKTPGAIVGLDNRCLDIPGNNLTPGTNLNVFDCWIPDSQLWSRDTSNHIIARAAPSSLFVDLENGSNADLTPVQIWTPNSPVTPGQQWTFENTEIRAIGDTCLSVPSLANNQPLQISTCTGAATQRWTVDAESRIKNGSFCVDSPNWSTTPGTRLQIFSCNGSTAQRFRFLTSGTIRFADGQASPPVCFDVVGGAPTSGSAVQLGACKAASDITRANQKYYLRGQIRSMGKCLDILGGTAFNGAPATLFQCHGGGSQIWDYYWLP